MYANLQQSFCSQPFKNGAIHHVVTALAHSFAFQTALKLPAPSSVAKAGSRSAFIVEDSVSHYKNAYDWLYRTDYGDYVGMMTVRQVSDTMVEIRTESDCVFKNDDGEQFIARGKVIVFDMNEGEEVTS